MRFEVARDRWAVRLRDGDGGFLYSSDLGRWSRELAAGRLDDFYLVIRPEGILEVEIGG